MNYYSLNGKSPRVDFREATIRGQAPDRGLYFPEELPRLPASLIQNIEDIGDNEIAFRMILPYVGDTIDEESLFRMVSETLSFPIPLRSVSDRISVLELFHGPTLAFKDVGARFMSRCLSYFATGTDSRITVLVATSGDTGGAVAHSFSGVENVDVVILYPSGKVSPLQEKQLTTLGGNIRALEITGDFDDCQRMVKEAFADPLLAGKIFLTSANSINVARWLPQQFYYALAWKQWPEKDRPPVVSVPSGNFGNLCAGLLAHLSGIPAAGFIAACNANDVIPEYFRTGTMEGKPARATISNAMDVASPSNFARVLRLFGDRFEAVKDLVTATSTGDEVTRETIRKVFKENGYILDPHSAVAWHAIGRYLEPRPDLRGYIAATAHPVKFPEVVEAEIKGGVPVPGVVDAWMRRVPEKTFMGADYAELRSYLLALYD